MIFRADRMKPIIAIDFERYLLMLRIIKDKDEYNDK